MPVRGQDGVGPDHREAVAPGHHRRRPALDQLGEGRIPHGKELGPGIAAAAGLAQPAGGQAASRRTALVEDHHRASGILEGAGTDQARQAGTDNHNG